MTARLLTDAKMAQGPLTTARRMLFMWTVMSFLAIPTKLGSPQIVLVSFMTIFCYGQLLIGEIGA